MHVGSWVSVSLKFPWCWVKKFHFSKFKKCLQFLLIMLSLQCRTKMHKNSCALFYREWHYWRFSSFFKYFDYPSIFALICQPSEPNFVNICNIYCNSAYFSSFGDNFSNCQALDFVRKSFTQIKHGPYFYP